MQQAIDLADSPNDPGEVIRQIRIARAKMGSILDVLETRQQGIELNEQLRNCSARCTLTVDELYCVISGPAASFEA